MIDNDQELSDRIRKLFDAVPAKWLDDEKRGKSRIFVESCQLFDHNLNIASGEQVTHGDPANRWLDTPNTTFGGRCPRSFLEGTEDERDFLLRIIESVEDGAC